MIIHSESASGLYKSTPSITMDKWLIQIYHKNVYRNGCMQTDKLNIFGSGTDESDLKMVAMTSIQTEVLPSGECTCIICLVPAAAYAVGW